MRKLLDCGRMKKVAFHDPGSRYKDRGCHRKQHVREIQSRKTTGCYI
jgi:hypothetical protein